MLARFGAARVKEAVRPPSRTMCSRRHRPGYCGPRPGRGGWISRGGWTSRVAGQAGWLDKPGVADKLRGSDLATVGSDADAGRNPGGRALLLSRRGRFMN
jgi:hypothetical protein